MQQEQEMVCPGAPKPKPQRRLLKVVKSDNGRFIIDLDGLDQDTIKIIEILTKDSPVFEKKEDPIWKPKRGEKYYFNCSYGNCVDSFEVALLDNDDTNRYDLGNVFKTREAAQRMADRRKRIGIFENKMMEFADGYEFAYGIRNWSIFYYGWSQEWKDNYHTEYNPIMIYMTKENAQKAVEWANEHYPEGL